MTMTDKELDAIRDLLDTKRQQKRDIALAKAQKEIDTINREYEAYWDGIYDAIKAVKAVLSEPPKGE